MQHRWHFHLRATQFCCAIAVLALCGCQLLESLAQNVDKPTARVTGVTLKDLNLSASTLLFDVEVSNPYAVELPLAQLTYGIASRGKPFLSGEADVSGSVPANGRRTVPLEARIGFADTLKLLEGVRPGSIVPYAADITLGVDAPGVGPLSLPLHKEGEFPIPTVPEVALEGVQWEGLTLDKATGLFKVRVTNKNEFPLELSKLSYGVTLGTHRLAESAVEQPASFAAGEANELTVRTSFAPKDLGLAAFTLFLGKGADYKLGGTLSAKTPFGPMEFPFERSGKTAFSK